MVRMADPRKIPEDVITAVNQLTRSMHSGTLGFVKARFKETSEDVYVLVDVEVRDRDGTNSNVAPLMVIPSDHEAWVDTLDEAEMGGPDRRVTLIKPVDVLSSTLGDARRVD